MGINKIYSSERGTSILFFHRSDIEARSVYRAIEHDGLHGRCRKKLMLRVARRRSLYSFSNTANSLFVEQRKVSIPDSTAREPRIVSERA